MSVWGLNEDLRRYARFLAGLGYAVIAPNLFWRFKQEHAFEYHSALLGEVSDLSRNGDDEEAVQDICSAAHELRTLAGCKSVGAIGWCYGGRIACIAATSDVFDAVVAFYPTVLETRLDIVARLARPLLLHLPEIEHYATRDDAIATIAAFCEAEPKIALHIYAGTTHGFGFSPPHPSHDADAARLADTRSALFLQRTLRL